MGALHLGLGLGRTGLLVRGDGTLGLGLLGGLSLVGLLGVIDLGGDIRDGGGDGGDDRNRGVGC